MTGEEKNTFWWKGIRELRVRILYLHQSLLCHPEERLVVFFLCKAYFLNVLMLTMSCDLSKWVVNFKRLIRFLFVVYNKLVPFQQCSKCILNWSWIRWVLLIPSKIMKILLQILNDSVSEIWVYRFLRNEFRLYFLML